MIDRLEETLKKYNEITEELTRPETLSNISLCPDWKDTNIIDSIYWICIGF